MDKTNTVAKILKVYGIINGIGSCILAIVLADNLPGSVDYLWVVELGAGLLSSLFIYAFGEVIQLLQDIKSNTSVQKADAPVLTSDELPEI
jgi:hypothetical protein